MHNAIQPTLVLATRGGKKLGVIQAEAINYGDSLTNGSELQFTVHKELDGIICNLWEDITDLKLVWCPEWDIWFEISVETSEQDDTVKNVSGIALGEAELSQINLYEMEINTEEDIARDDYVPTVLYNPDNIGASLLHRMISKAPHYKIGYVDESIKRIQRTFQFDNISIRDAFEQVGEEIDCLFIFNSGSDANGNIAREINVFDLCSVCEDCGERGRFTGVCPECGSSNVKEGYGDDTNVFVSVENLADDVTYTTDKDSVKNCFRLVAGDDLMTATIKNCNPNGSNYIWHITDEMRSDMSDALKAKLAAYDALYNQYRNENSIAINSTVVSNYNSLVNKYKVYDPDIETVSNPIVGYSALIRAYYNAIDLKYYLQDSLMPNVEMSSTSATEQAGRLISNALSPVSVTSISNISEATASSAVLLMAKTIVNPSYQVKVKTSSLSGTTWTGSFTVTNYGDEEDKADSATISVVINDNYERFVRQKLTKVMAEQSDEVTDISSLFALELAAFKNEIKKYCLASLRSFYDSATACLNILIEQGVSDSGSDLYTSLYLPYYNKQSAIQSEIRLRENEIAIADGRYDVYGGVVTFGMQSTLHNKIVEIQSILDFEKYVGTQLMKELSAYRREDTYSNDNYISTGLNNAEIVQNANAFIRVAENELIKSATLQHAITATLKNLLVMKEFAGITEHFSVGNWIRIRVDDRVYKLRLVEYNIDYDNLDNLSVEFSDVTRVASGITDVESILSKASSMATSYDAVTRQSLQGSTAKDRLDGWIERGLSLTKMKIIDNAENQNIQIDERGILCREYLPITSAYDSRQLKIINRGLYLTDDGWYTSRAGIGNFIYYDPSDKQDKEGYGVVADMLIGHLILSEKVGVYNKSGAIKMDDKGITLISSVKTGVTNVFKIQKEAADGSLTDVIWFDNAGNAHFAGDISAATGTFSGTFDGTLADGSVTASTIAGNAVTSEKIAAGAITGTKIYDGAISSEKIAESAITETKISGGAITTGKLAANAVTAAKISAGAIGTDQLAANAVTAAKIKAGEIGTDQLAANAVTATKIKAGAIGTDQLAANAITAAKISAGAIGTDQLSANAVTAAKLSASAVTADKIASNAITSDKISANAVTSAKISAGAIGTDQLAANAVTATKISAGAIGTDQLAANAVTTAKLNAGAVTAAKISAGAIGTDQLAANAVTAAKISAGAIGTDQLAANAITAAKIATGAITAGMITAGTIQDKNNNNSWNLDTGYLNTQSGKIGDFTLSAGSLSYENSSVTTKPSVKLSSGGLEVSAYDSMITTAKLSVVVSEGAITFRNNGTIQAQFWLNVNNGSSFSISAYGKTMISGKSDTSSYRSVYLNGLAAYAISDEDGNSIKSTYFKRSYLKTKEVTATTSSNGNISLSVYSPEHSGSKFFVLSVNCTTANYTCQPWRYNNYWYCRVYSGTDILANTEVTVRVAYISCDQFSS